MGNHAQSVSRRRSFSLPCPGYGLYARGGIFNVRGSNHTRAGSMSLGFVTLEPSLLVGSLAAIAGCEPLSRRAHVLRKHAFRTRVLVALQLQDKIVADTRRGVHEVLYSVLASNKSLLSTIPLSDGCNHHGSER